MKSFEYLRPHDLSEALDIMERYGAGAAPLLGGTDLTVRIQKGQADPAAVVDLKGVREIGASIDAQDGTVTVGARVVLSDLLRSDLMQTHYPALVEAASIVGSIQIRNRATLVGNICNASPAADTVPPLIAYAAEVAIVGAGGSCAPSSPSPIRRRIPLEDFFLGPGQTRRAPTELVVAVHLPVPGRPFGCAFGRLTRRAGVDLATINMACAVDAAGLTTFVFGAAGPTAVVARENGGELADADLPESRREELLRSLVEKTRPISDVRSGQEYRRAMLLAIARRVLQRALERRQEQTGRQDQARIQPKSDKEQTGRKHRGGSKG
jgi:CO/xanthine dehydrogenase FAD-binding subunit